jgi:hypothetical protein
MLILTLLALQRFVSACYMKAIGKSGELYAATPGDDFSMSRARKQVVVNHP